MNTYQTNLYNNLTALVESNEAFYFQDFNLDDKTYRIFNYRLASYTDWLVPGALECRGVMFEVQINPHQSDDYVPVRLASHPMEKFFNLNENPMTMNLDLNEVVDIQEKADGSLMSTYIHNDELRLKSKGSLFSDQANAAMKWLEKNPELKQQLAIWARTNHTVNLEWCSPEHRIVLGYLEPILQVLNVRNNDNGDYEDLSNTYLKKYMVEDIFHTNTIQEFVESIPKMQNIEGFVLRLSSGQRVKIKTEWYLSLHHAKDSVNNPRRLFECILDEGIDDIRSMFYDDELAMKIIDEMQVKVDHIYNNMVNAVETFYAENKDLDRKSYAIKGQQDASLKYENVLFFGLVMNKYVGKPVDYKAFLKGKWRDLGLRDTSLEKDE